MPTISLAFGLEPIDNDTTPSFTIENISLGDNVAIFSDENCSISVGSGVASGSSIEVTTDPLSLGESYRMHAQVEKNGLKSPCSNGVSYSIYDEKTGTITADENWSGLVYITGNLITEGQIVVEAGSQVYFANSSLKWDIKKSVLMNGTSENRISISTLDEKIPGQIEGDWYVEGLQAFYTDFSYLGDSVDDSLYFKVRDSDDYAKFDNCNFQHMGKINLRVYGVDGHLEISNSNFRNGLHTTEDVRFTSGVAGYPNVNNVYFNNNTFTNGVFISVNGMTIQENVGVGAGVEVFFNTNSARSLFHRNIIKNSNPSAGTYNATISVYANDLIFTDNYIKGGTWTLISGSSRQGGPLKETYLKELVLTPPMVIMKLFMVYLLTHYLLEILSLGILVMLL